MNFKRVYALSFAGSLGLRLYWVSQGRCDDPWFLLPLEAALMAFLLPISWWVGDIERYVFHYPPWQDGHEATSWLVLLTVASFLWFFPFARVRQWIGGAADGLPAAPSIDVNRTALEE